MNSYQKFIYLRTYSRWLEDKGRREDWNETVDRYEKFFDERVPESLRELFGEAMRSIKDLEVMPSMRVLWTSGKALALENIAGYNCAYIAIEKPKDFAEVLYILMNGTGVGFTVEKEAINKLPKIPKVLEDIDKTIVVGDSKLGWAEAYNEYLQLLYKGKIAKVDYSQIRPAGERLKTFGGRASGPDPLRELFEFTLNTFKGAKGRKFNSIEVYDIVTTIASIVIVGGVRRSATISLSDLQDKHMRDSKIGQFWIEHPNRALSNNSAIWSDNISRQVFNNEFKALIASGSGERGIVNRDAIRRQMEKFGRDNEGLVGVNPCGEVLLHPKEFCNLSEVVIRPTDSLEDLKGKIKLATLLATLQSTLDDFNFLDKAWYDNIHKDRILGVSLTGLRDHPILSKVSAEAKQWLRILRKTAYIASQYYAEELGINPPKAITSIKPSGTVSQLVNTASGMHPRYADY